MDINSREKEIFDYLNQFIVDWENKANPIALKQDQMIKDAKKFMNLLGDPQNKIKVIHVAGTTGKGSTVHYLTSILHALGFKVGSTISPHTLTIRERIQINGKNIAIDDFEALVDKSKSKIEEMKERYGKSPSFFEIMIGLAYLYFYEQNVDYAVMETGAGGRLDATNTADREDKVGVITKIGLDHQHILGDTVVKIAGEKAGIIHPGNRVFKLDQPEVNHVFVEKAKKEAASLMIVSPLDQVTNIQQEEQQITFDFEHKGVSLKSLVLKPAARFLLENLAYVLTIMCELFPGQLIQDHENQIREAILNTDNTGRFTIMKKGSKTLIIDGAHNIQKMEGFLQSLSAVYPGKKFPFLLSFKKGKDYKEMLDQLLPFVRSVIVTSIDDATQGMDTKNVPLPDIEAYLQSKGFENYQIVGDSKQALEALLATRHSHAVITGSGYLAGAMITKLTQTA